MKRFLQKAVCLILLFLLALPAKAYASNGSGNMDGGGSGMGQGTSTNYWTPGYDGVRITVVDASSGSAVSSPCLLYTSPSPRDTERSRMPSSA